jgi:hypothetical protein
MNGGHVQHRPVVYFVERSRRERGAAQTRDFCWAFTPSGASVEKNTLSGLHICTLCTPANRHVPVDDIFAGSGRAMMEKRQRGPGKRPATCCRAGATIALSSSHVSCSPVGRIYHLRKSLHPTRAPAVASTEPICAPSRRVSALDCVSAVSSPSIVVRRYSSRANYYIVPALHASSHHLRAARSISPTS